MQILLFNIYYFVLQQNTLLALLSLLSVRIILIRINNNLVAENMRNQWTRNLDPKHVSVSVV